MSVLQSKRRAIINEPHLATLSGAVVTMDKAEYAPMGVVANFAPVQDLHGQTAPYPDSNICPITGWTGCNVYDDSKYGGLVEWNQLISNGDFSDGTTDWIGNYATTSVVNNVCTATATGSNPMMRAKPINYIANHRILILMDFNPIGIDTSATLIMLHDGTSIIANNVLGSYNKDTWHTLMWMLKRTKSYQTLQVRIYFDHSSSAKGREYQLRRVQTFDLTQMFGETVAEEIATMETEQAGAGVAYFKSLFYKDYYPYSAGGTLMTVGQVNGEPYRAVNVDWTDTAGTVYGGSLDLATGVLTAKYGYVDLGTLNYTYTYKEGIPSRFRTTLTNGKYGINLYCTQYKTTQAKEEDKTIYFADSYYGTNALIIWDSSYTDATTFKTAMSGVYLAYELATPITYTLTPTQIKSLRGKNNVWTDMNAPTDVSAWVH